MSRKVDEWGDRGRDIARQRYGEPTARIPRPSESSEPQDKLSRRAGDGTVPQSWVTGRGEDATAKPNFDHSADRKGRR